MRLLVSVANAEEAEAALAGGADVIDAKDPLTGALGAVSLPTLRSIITSVNGLVPVSAALGDASDPAVLERNARLYASTGVAFVKIGFAGISSLDRIDALIAAAVRGADTASDVVAVFYADADHGLAFADVVAGAAVSGARGVLIDTSNKNGPGLTELVQPLTLADWIAAAHAVGLFIAIAGKLTAGDLPTVRNAGADIAGIRGAACGHGRISAVSSEKVRLLAAAQR